MKNQFNRNDPVHDEWWDNQETMTRRMLRSAQKINPQASLDETLAGSLNQSSITSAEMNITEEGILNDVGENSMSSLEFKKSVKFDPTLPQPWDEDTPLGRALRKVSVAAVHYDRNKDGVYINAFRGGGERGEDRSDDDNSTTTPPLTQRSLRETGSHDSQSVSA